MTTPPKAEEILAIARHTEHNIGVCDCVNGLSIEQQIMEIVQSYANAVSEQRVKEATDYLTKRLIKQIDKARNEALDEASNCLLDEAILGRDHSWLLRCDYANKIRSLKREPR